MAKNTLADNNNSFSFFPLKEKEKYYAKLDDYSWYSNGSVIDTDTETENVVNCSFGGRSLIISLFLEWDNIADGLCAIGGEERKSLLVTVDGEEYKVPLKYFYSSSFNKHRNVLWEKDKLLATINRWYKTPDEVLGIAFNLNFRHRLPEALQNYDKFEEISSWVKEHPEESKRIQNIEALA